MEFARLHDRACSLIAATPPELLYQQLPSSERDSGSLRSEKTTSGSIGEFVLRAAGAVEQTFGGLTANLWDDPIEWTLPEMLASRESVLEYLAEVEETRQRAFASFHRDQDLLKTIGAPSGEMRPLLSLLLKTLVRALAYQARAVMAMETYSITRPSGFII